MTLPIVVGSDPQHPSDKVLLEEFKQLVKVGKNYFELFLKSFVVYMAVLGLLIKMFFSAAPASPERWTLFCVATIMNIGAIVITAIGRRHFLMIAAHFREVSSRLGVRDVYFPGLVGTAKGFLGLLVAIGLMWAIAGYRFMSG